MKIQKGIVKYKNRNDIVCTYGITDDGISYYFLDENDSKKLANGNRIVTTALVEAIDPMAKCSNIGVIADDGHVVIPCENHSIKEINDQLLLVETAQPTSLSVIEAINLKNDPLSAAKLVSTPAAVKDKLNGYVGTEGKYLFNDQFSEATVCDIDGNNLLNGESYSFVVMANDKLYLSKNVPEESIVEFSLTDKCIVNTGMIDVSTAVVDPSVVEGALASESTPVSDAIVDTPSDAVVDVSADVANSEEFASPEDVQAVADTSVLDVPAASVDAVASTEGETTENQMATETGDMMDPAMSVAIPYDDSLADDTQVQAEDGSANVVAEASDITIPKMDDDAVSEDLKAFTDGAPLGEEDMALGDAEDVADVPIAIDEQDEITGDEAIPSVDEIFATPSDVSEDKSDEMIPIVEEETADVPAVPALGEDKVETTLEPPVAETTEDAVETPEQELQFNDNVMAQEAVPIKPDDVASMVDKDQNGVIDSTEREDFYSSIGRNTHTDYYQDREPIESYGASSYVMPRSVESSYPSYSDTLTVLPNVDRSRIGGYDSYESRDNNIKGAVVQTISELMSQNREQRSAIKDRDAEIDRLRSDIGMYSNKVKDQTMQIRTLDDNYSRAKATNQMLEGQIRELEKTVMAQDKELKSLRSQRDDIVRAVADVSSFFAQNNPYEDASSGDYRHYRRAA